MALDEAVAEIDTQSECCEERVSPPLNVGPIVLEMRAVPVTDAHSDDDAVGIFVIVAGTVDDAVAVSRPEKVH